MIRRFLALDGLWLRDFVRGFVLGAVLMTAYLVVREWLFNDG